MTAGPGAGAHDLVLAVDCSTTAVKAVVHDRSGPVLRVARPLTTHQPAASWHEQDAEDWWRATVEAVHEAVAALPDPGLVRALCLTHQRETFVCLDAAGRPMRPAILWLDGRASTEIRELGTARVHELSGKPPDTTPAIYKLAWLSRHEPDVLRQAHRVGDVQAYLAWRLTGRWATSLASADTLGLLDLRQERWSPALLELAGVRPEQLPELEPTGGVLGVLSAAVTRELGLPRPIPLVAGLGDGQAAGLGVDAQAPGVAYLNLGTSMVMGLQADRYRWSSAFRTMAGTRRGRYTYETVLNAAAYLASWTVEQFGAGLDRADLEAEAARVPPGAEGLLTLPYWNAAQTPYWDASARGAVVGWHGRHTPAHLYRSVLEGVAFEIQLHLEHLEEATGDPVRTIRAVGGGARSALWAQILSDVTRRTVHVYAEAEASAAGAARVAWAHVDGAESQAPSLAESRVVSPHPDAAERYGSSVSVYRRLYPALKDVFAELAAGGSPSGPV